MYFEYCDNNDIVKDLNGRIIFRTYLSADNKLSDCPVPFNKNTQTQCRPENTIEVGIDGNLYDIGYYHNGYIMSIDAL